MRKLRILALVSKPAGMSPSQRYRFEQWAPHLAKTHAIEVDFAPFESPGLADLLYQPGHFIEKAWQTLAAFARRSKVIPRAPHYDMVVIHREAALIGPAIYERLLARTGTPIIYDFDDAVWSSTQLAVNGPFSRLHFFGKTSTICKLADAVTTGNEFLARYARIRNSSVQVIPSSIELASYPLIDESREKEKLVVCWTGSNSTLAHFDHARAALELLAQRLPLIVKVICNKPPETSIKGAEMRFCKWSAEHEAEDVGDCHVGIMPLPDNEATRGKSGMKMLQYMATGRPVVASPVGVNSQIIEHNENGFLAGSVEEWVIALEALARDAKLRFRLGQKARATVEKQYSAEASAKKFAELVRSILD